MARAAGAGTGRVLYFGGIFLRASGPLRLGHSAEIDITHSDSLETGDGKPWQVRTSMRT